MILKYMSKDLMRMFFGKWAIPIWVFVYLALSSSNLFEFYGYQKLAMVLKELKTPIVSIVAFTSCGVWQIYKRYFECVCKSQR